MSPLKKACKYLKKYNLSIATAESITGGMIASELVSVSGISKHFEYGFVTYSNDAKKNVLGVREKTLDKYTEISHETAREMAKFVRNIAGSDVSLASTGIAGPGGGTKEHPVGCVYISCAIDKYVVTRKFIFKGTRFAIRLRTANAAFRLLNDCIEKFIV